MATNVQWMRPRRKCDPPLETHHQDDDNLGREVVAAVVAPENDGLKRKRSESPPPPSPPPKDDDDAGTITEAPKLTEAVLTLRPDMTLREVEEYVASDWDAITTLQRVILQASPPSHNNNNINDSLALSTPVSVWNALCKALHSRRHIHQVTLRHLVVPVEILDRKRKWSEFLLGLTVEDVTIVADSPMQAGQAWMEFLHSSASLEHLQLDGPATQALLGLGKRWTRPFLPALQSLSVRVDRSWASQTPCKAVMQHLRVYFPALARLRLDLVGQFTYESLSEWISGSQVSGGLAELVLCVDSPPPRDRHSHHHHPWITNVTADKVCLEVGHTAAMPVHAWLDQAWHLTHTVASATSTAGMRVRWDPPAGVPPEEAARFLVTRACRRCPNLTGVVMAAPPPSQPREWYLMDLMDDDEQHRETAERMVDSLVWDHH